MTTFLRWLKRTREKWLGTFYGGPEPPERLRRIALLFANDSPAATRAEWLEAMVHLAGEAYRSGYMQGWERNERDAASVPWRQQPPDEVADALTPGWRNGPSVLLAGAEAIVGEGVADDEEMNFVTAHVPEMEPFEFDD
jgi:hypothetical protein